MKSIVFACLVFACLIFAASLSITNANSQTTTSLSSSLIEKPMIVGGELAAEDDWPSIAALTYTVNSTQRFHCAATFIGSKWAITAAHCVVNNDVDAFNIYVGAYDLTNNVTPSAIERIYIHSDYSASNSYDNDIALIELAETLEHPNISLLTEDETRELALSNTIATVIGWGSTIAYGAGDSPPMSSQENTLRQVELSLLSNEECKSKLVAAYKTFYNANYSTEQVGISDNMICAHSADGGTGSCQGDSGGPLMVNTNQGWQQIGIVSHGIGCGEAAFPDVYTRVSKYTDWINGITQGVTFESDHNFTITPQYQNQTKSIEITNHSDLTANLTFTLVADDPDNSGFSVTSDNCTTLDARESCFIIVTFDAQKIGQQVAQITINSKDISLSTNNIFLTAQALATHSSIESQLTSNVTDFRWFSGGEQTWQLANNDNAIQSGEITDGQESSVLLTFSGEGSLSFEWAISSEQSTLESANTLAVLYLIVDGEQIDFISGEVPYSNVSVDNLTAGEHQVLWLYQKNSAVIVNESENNNENRAYLKNVVFTPQSQLETSQTKSSGGTTYCILLLLTFMFIRRLYGNYGGK